VATSTAPYKSGETVLTTTTTYDTYNRPATASNTIGTTTYGYSYASGNLTLTLTNPAGQVSSKVMDADNKMLSATDYGGTLNYTYNSQGNVLEVKQGTTTLASNEYDAYARQTKLTDINAGITQYGYSALGQLTSQISAMSQTTTNAYDLLGRITQRVGPEGTTTYEYFPSGSGVATNQIKKITGFAGELQEFTYDAFGRVSTDKTTVDATTHTTSYTYNTYSDVTSTTYPSGFVLNTTYDANGYLSTLKNGANTVTLFTNNGMNGFNQYTAYALGNGKSSSNSYYFGTPTRYLTSAVQDLNLSWNYQSGNLNSRYDAIKNKTESFSYDNLNRLLTSSGTGLSTITMTYAGNGNISTKTDAGNYSYGIGKINAVTAVTNPSANIPLIVHNVTYTPYFQPAQIVEGSHQMTLTYGADYQRIKSVLTQNGSTLTTRYYFGGYEKDITGGSTRHLHYISSGQNLVAMVLRENGTDTYYYTYTDHLGSILTLTNSGGTIVAEQNFDAWGRKRNTSTWGYTGVQSVPSWLYRGFTGHEQLPEFGLINMNGRLYDPIVARMLSPDNNVQMADFTQNYNRYSYALNNPLRITDPDGEFLQTALWASTFLGEFVSNLISGRSNALGNAFKQANSVVSTVGNVGQFPVYQSNNTIISVGVNPFALGVGVNIAHRSGDITTSLSAGIGLNGPFIGRGVAYSGSIGNVPVNLGVGISATSSGIGYGFNADIDGFGGGYSLTHYSDVNSARGQMKQTVGGVSLKIRDFSFRIENDFLSPGPHQDRGRTNAVEVGFKNFVIGTNLYTNDPKGEEAGIDKTVRDMKGRLNPKEGAWMPGYVYSAPLWVGTRFGNTVDRVGYSHPWVQNATQNSLHIGPIKAFHAPFFTDYSKFRYGGYTFTTFNNPYSLFER
jgi:RHS repeat-associated protein